MIVQWCQSHLGRRSWHIGLPFGGEIFEAGDLVVDLKADRKQLAAVQKFPIKAYLRLASRQTIQARITPINDHNREKSPVFSYPSEVLFVVLNLKNSQKNKNKKRQ